ncbi:MAG TPA: GNAT family N-acetyltransferase [Phycicoccus sp.]|nr:GNAT family N-acetyltransferase [Phycicoccus sp.]HRA44598.1 GNAT family N-acetyltransferase [Phycicoccus sp.]
MARTNVEVVALSKGGLVDDALERELTGLWMAQRVDTGSTPEAAARAVADGRLREALRRPDVRAWLARSDGVGIGYVVASENPFGLSAVPEVAIDQLFVDRRVRRQGVAHALLESVLGHAERIGSEVVVSNVPAQSREANRFFARLGFGSVVLRRASSTAALRRRLSPGAKPELLEALRRRRSSLGAAALRQHSA